MTNGEHVLVFGGQHHLWHGVVEERIDGTREKFVVVRFFSRRGSPLVRDGFDGPACDALNAARLISFGTVANA